MKDITRKIAVILNVRAESNRIPNKMLTSFAGKSLFEICLRKLCKSKVFGLGDIVLSYDHHNQRFEDIIGDVEKDNKIEFNYYPRSVDSLKAEEDQTLIYEFHKYLLEELKYEYFILVNPCCPLLSIQTIDSFYSTFKYSDKEGLFGVIKKQNYFWDSNKVPYNLPLPGGIMNTKNPNCKMYEAAHCLYGSKTNLVDKKKFMGGFTKELGPELFIVPENETFDIDYPWQFEQGEILYKGLING